MRKILVILFAVVLMLHASASFASSVTWTDWQTWNPENGSASGTLNYTSDPINVSLNGNFNAIIKGDGYYNNQVTGDYTNPTSTYAGLAPSDMVVEDGIVEETVTLNFSKPIVNPYLALVNIGNKYGDGVTYSFQSPLTVIAPSSCGPNCIIIVPMGYNITKNPLTGYEYDGTYSSYGLTGYSNSGYSITGYEYNGILKFNGTFSSMTLNINQPKYWCWNAFNIGTEGVAPTPEPSSMVLGLMGIGSLFGLKRRK